MCVCVCGRQGCARASASASPGRGPGLGRPAALPCLTTRTHPPSHTSNRPHPSLLTPLPCAAQAGPEEESTFNEAVFGQAPPSASQYLPPPAPTLASPAPHAYAAGGGGGAPGQLGAPTQPLQPGQEVPQVGLGCGAATVFPAFSVPAAAAALQSRALVLSLSCRRCSASRPAARRPFPHPTSHLLRCAAPLCPDTNRSGLPPHLPCLPQEVLDALRPLPPSSFLTLLSNFYRGLKGRFKVPTFAHQELDLHTVGGAVGVGGGVGGEGAMRGWVGVWVRGLHAAKGAHPRPPAAAPVRGGEEGVAVWVKWRRRCGGGGGRRLGVGGGQRALAQVAGLPANTRHTSTVCCMSRLGDTAAQPLACLRRSLLAAPRLARYVVCAITQAHTHTHTHTPPTTPPLPRRFSGA